MDKEEILYVLKTILIVSAFIIIIGLSAIYGMDKEEQQECHKWQEWSKEYSGFFITPAEKEQCDHHNIIINAPVSR